MSYGDFTAAMSLAVAILTAAGGVLWARIEAVARRSHKNASEITALWATLHARGITVPPRRNGEGVK